MAKLGENRQKLAEMGCFLFVSQLGTENLHISAYPSLAQKIKLPFSGFSAYFWTSEGSRAKKNRAKPQYAPKSGWNAFRISKCKRTLGIPLLSKRIPTEQKILGELVSENYRFRFRINYFLKVTVAQTPDLFSASVKMFVGINFSKVTVIVSGKIDFCIELVTFFVNNGTCVGPSLFWPHTWTIASKEIEQGNEMWKVERQLILQDSGCLQNPQFES